MAMYPCLSLPPISFPSVSGAVCSFDSQYAGLPLKSHIVDIDYTGSAISGVNISASSKNLVSWEYLNLHGWGGSDSTLVRQLNHLIEGTYTVQYKIKVVTLQSGYTGGNYGLLLRAVDNGVNFNITMREDKTNVSEGDIFTYTATFTLPSNYVGKFTSAYYYTGRSPSNSSDYCDFYDFQIEKGTTATAYEQPTDFYIPFGSTIYGGSYNAITGIATSTKAADGTDITPVNYQCSTVNIETQGGVNNVFADTGDTTLQYIKLG